MKFALKTFRFLIWTGFAAICGLVLISASMYLYLSPALPDAQSLKDTKLQTPMRVLTSDNKLIAQFGKERRSPLTFDQIPLQFVQALIAIEDKRFEIHSGVDPVRFTRVVLDLLMTGNKEGAGGSTLTQQVARNYFYTQQKTFTRKFREIILALKMESELSKAEIFELYINKHFLGYNSYGIQAAATYYYGKNINDLTLAQLAVIAGLHQAPSGANPIAHADRAKKRRNNVLYAMQANDFITPVEYQIAVAEPITAEPHGNNPEIEASYFAEMVRSKMYEQYGESAYTDGYTVYTTITMELQAAATTGVRKALIDYSRRHGYTGPEKHIASNAVDPHSKLQYQLKMLNRTPIYGGLTPALVVHGNREFLTVIAKNETTQVNLPIESIQWARKRISVDELDIKVMHAYQVAVPGDIVRLEKTNEGWLLAQIPKAQGALVALSPNNGSIQALVGGFDFSLNKFNRVTQSERQPGSNFKPFIYTAALDYGYTPATIVNDAPLIRIDPALEGTWRPKNSGNHYFGPIPLRQALYQSRNVSSLRVLDDIGIKYAKNYVTRFGFNPDRLLNNLTLILGSNVMTPLKIATGYAVFANGGYKVEPYFIDRIEDRDGNTVFEENPKVVCRGCLETPKAYETREETPLETETIAIDIAPFALEVDEESVTQVESVETAKRYASQVLSPQTAFLIDSMLKDVVQKGTARAAKKALPRNDIAGKTGTTDYAVDTWFTGYNGDFVASAWVGNDNNTSIGLSEYGAKAALPAWVEFMKIALANKELNNLPQPVGIVQKRIDPATGLLAKANTPDARFEYFNKNNAPTTFSDSSGTIDFSAEQVEFAPEDSDTIENSELLEPTVEGLF